jgi:hypothetical protein
MSRAPGVSATLVLPPPPDKYDPADQRELRRLIVEATRQLPQWGAVTSVPAPVSSFGALVGAADMVPYFTGVSALALASLTPYARTLIACATATAARTALGLGTLATLSTVTEGELTLADVTTANVSITKHGFAPKAPNDASKYLDGTGAYTTPAAATVPPAFPTISNWELGLDAALSVTTHVDGLVTGITDISGNARNATNGSTAGKPRYLLKAFNDGYPCWWFDGTNNQHLVVTIPNISAPATIILVVQNLVVGTGDGNLYRDQTLRGVGYLNAGNTWSIFGNTSGFGSAALYTQSQTTIPTGGLVSLPCIRIDLYNNASSLIANNATEVTGTAASTTTLFGGTLNIGNGATAVTSAAKFLLRGFHIFSKALSLSERNQIRTYYADPLIAGIRV